MTAPALPPCGIYRTATAIGTVEAGRLVYFHNHGKPGPGIYFPEKWNHNRAQFSANGMTLPEPFDPRWLHPLPAEGLYRVARAFYCCEKKCTQFEPEALVQLGYNGAAKPLLFVPEISSRGISVPERGTAIDDAAFASLVALKVSQRQDEDPEISLPRGIIVH